VAEEVPVALLLHTNLALVCLFILQLCENR
jgi:hypothetical protein